MPPTGFAARRYAEALADLAAERRVINEVRGSLDRVAQALSGEALRLLAAPSFPLKTRRRALDAAFGEEASAVRSLLVTLLERDRIALLPAITRAYHDLIDARAGIEKAVITTAAALDERERRSLIERLERASGKRLRPTFAHDPSLIGGALVRIGDHQIDGSVRTRLASLRERLAAGE